MPLSWIESTLHYLERADLLRELRTMESASAATVRLGGREVLNLASNNYLGLANHPRVIAAVRDALDSWGWGAGASQLVNGNTELHMMLCKLLAAMEGKEDCVLYPTGYQANVGAITALMEEGDLILLDKLDHASIIDGARLSGATVRVYPHNTLRKLERLLSRSEARRTLVVTDTVFSMDGDVAPLVALVDLCEKHNAPLMVDEAHATGVLGANGSGACEMCGVKGRVPIIMGTLSKALGGVGGFVCGSKQLCDFLRNTSRSAIYTTALPPAAAAGAAAALTVIHDEPWRREAVLARAAQLRDRLRAGGGKVPEGHSAIVPVIVGDPETALTLSSRLLQQDILAPAIRPPTVPPGTSRLRLSLMATHTPEQVDTLADAILKELRG